MSHNINNISINNFNNLCRTCSQSDNLVSIHENKYLIEMLSTSVQIQIQLNDEFPKNICVNCIDQLNQSYAFINKCRTTDAAFRQCLTQQKVLKLRKNYEKTNEPETTEEVFIKTETSDIDDIILLSDGDDCWNPKVTIKQPEQINLEFEIKNASTQPEINHYTDVCSNVNESFATDPELVSNSNDCQFTNLLEPMELIESSDDESHDDPLNDTTNSPPEKSRSRYKKERLLFLKYCKERKLKEFTEDVLLDYFHEKSKIMKPSFLWATYSMLKSPLNYYDGINISKYKKLLAFLQRNAVEYKAKVSKTFTREEVNRFLHEAPDEYYLMIKVTMIMGIAGGCTRKELMRMSIDDIEDKDSILIVTVPHPSPKKTRTFLITKSEPDWMIIYRRYYAYRALLNTEHRRLFTCYPNKFFFNFLGKRSIKKVQKLIAEYLELANPWEYNGNCFRLTSFLFYNRAVWKTSVKIKDDGFPQ